MNPKKDFLFSKNTFKKRRRKARKAVDRRQDRSISKLYRLVKFSSERKNVDQSNTTSIGTTWSQILNRPLTYIAAGGDNGQRIADKLLIQRIQLKVRVTPGDTTNMYRILIVRFGHCPTASLGLQNVLQDVSAATPYQIMSFRKRNAPSKYELLWDSGMRSTIGNGSTAEAPYGPRSVINHNIVLKFPKGKLVQYSDNTASSETNGYTYVVACTDSSIAPHPGFQVLSRVIYSG